jgi:hypothetical protein
MDYPSCLLPKRNYKLIKSKFLPKESYLIRRSKKSIPESFDDNNDIRIDALIEKPIELFGLSWNILGVFKEEHLKYRVKKDVDWKPCMKKINIFDIKSEIVPNAFPLYLRIWDVHTKRFPYNNPVRQYETGKRLKLKREELEEFKNKELKGFLHILHKPKLVNYWHFEFEFKDEEKNVIEKKSSEWKKRAANSAFSSLLKNHVKARCSKYEKLKIHSFVYFIPCFIRKFFSKS